MFENKCQKRKLKISIYWNYRKLLIIFLRTDWMPKKKKKRKLKISIYWGYRKSSIIFSRTDWMPEKNWLDAKRKQMPKKKIED